MAERSMAVVLKTTEPETVPGVRIPLSPPTFALNHAKVGEPTNPRTLLAVLLLFTCILLIGTRTASAQGLGYGIAGPAGNSGVFGSTALHAAGGGELLVNGRASIGGEVGILANAGSVPQCTTSVFERG
jgi:hypothetical protein